MNKQLRILLFILTFALLAAANALAATIPAGTILVVKTIDVISSNQAPGTKFQCQLVHALGADGKVVIPAGTKVTGKIVSSRRMLSSRERLTVTLTEAMVGNRTIHLKTAVMDLENFTGSSGVSFAHEFYHVAAGRTLKFHVNHPVQI